MSNVKADRRPDHPTNPTGRAGGSLPAIESKAITHEEFSTLFDRNFDRVYAYVRKRVGIEPVCERVVKEVLASNLHLIIHCVDQKHVASRLKAVSDRLIETEAAVAENAGLETLTAAVDRLGRAGFQESFQVRERKLYSLDGRRLYEPGELIVGEIVRFEGESDPGDSTVLFALRSRDGSMRGTFVAGYGAAADPESAHVVSRLRAGHDAETRALEHQRAGSASVLERGGDPTPRLFR